MSREVARLGQDLRLEPHIFCVRLLYEAGTQSIDRRRRRIGLPRVHACGAHGGGAGGVLIADVNRLDRIQVLTDASFLCGHYRLDKASVGKILRRSSKSNFRFDGSTNPSPPPHLTAPPPDAGGAGARCNMTLDSFLFCKQDRLL